MTDVVAIVGVRVELGYQRCALLPPPLHLINDLRCFLELVFVDNDPAEEGSPAARQHAHASNVHGGLKNTQVFNLNNQILFEKKNAA